MTPQAPLRAENRFTRVSVVGNLPVMYQCKTPPIQSRKDRRVFRAAYSFIAAWRAESPGSRPYVRTRLLERRQKVFIDDFHSHIESKALADAVGRYRLLPCAKEVLKNSTEPPVVTADGNLIIDGMTPDGTRFRVIIRPEKRGGVLQSFYPL